MLVLRKPARRALRVQLVSPLAWSLVPLPLGGIVPVADSAPSGGDGSPGGGGGDQPGACDGGDSHMVITPGGGWTGVCGEEMGTSQCTIVLACGGNICGDQLCGVNVACGAKACGKDDCFVDLGCASDLCLLDIGGFGAGCGSRKCLEDMGGWSLPCLIAVCLADLCVVDLWSGNCFVDACDMNVTPLPGDGAITCTTFTCHEDLGTDEDEGLA